MTSDRTSATAQANSLSKVPYLPALDGLRALAVVAVMVYHANSEWLPGGFLGVEVFFVLSGYLITLLLLAEHDRDGAIDLRSFGRDEPDDCYLRFSPCCCRWRCCNSAPTRNPREYVATSSPASSTAQTGSSCGLALAMRQVAILLLCATCGALRLKSSSIAVAARHDCGDTQTGGALDGWCSFLWVARWLSRCSLRCFITVDQSVNARQRRTPTGR